MRSATVVCLLILIPSSLRAQDRKSDWKALYGLRAGEKIELIETGMKKHVGTFSTVTEEAIQMREGSNDIGIPKEGVARVTVLDKSHRLRNSLIFGGVGAGTGAGIAAAATRCSSSNNSFSSCDFGRGLVVAIGAVAGLVGGAGVGAAIPSHPTIYRADPAKSSAPR
jgi:hypothetical protein